MTRTADARLAERAVGPLVAAALLLVVPPALAQEVPDPSPDVPGEEEVSPEEDDQPYTPAYASDLDDLVVASGAALWVHGHTHLARDYRLGATRVVSNPRGYPDQNGDSFDAGLVLEV